MTKDFNSGYWFALFIMLAIAGVLYVALTIVDGCVDQTKLPESASDIQLDAENPMDKELTLTLEVDGKPVPVTGTVTLEWVRWLPTCPKCGKLFGGEHAMYSQVECRPIAEGEFLYFFKCPCGYEWQVRPLDANPDQR